MPFAGLALALALGVAAALALAVGAGLAAALAATVGIASFCPVLTLSSGFIPLAAAMADHGTP